MEDIKENLINELADAFVSGEGAKKDSEGSRFNKATGTLIASNTFINYALSHISEEGFTKGKVYKCRSRMILHVLSAIPEKRSVSISMTLIFLLRSIHVKRMIKYQKRIKQNGWE